MANLSATGNITTAQYFVGNGSQLTGVIAQSISNYGNAEVGNYLPTYTGYFGNLSNVTVTGTIQTTGIIYGNSGIRGNITTSAQPYITSLGNLTSLVMTGAITPYANVGVDIGSTTAYWNNIYAAAVYSSTHYGTLQTSSQPYITSVGTLNGLTVGGAPIPNANATVNLGSSSAYWNNTYTNALFSANLYGTLQTASQTNITSVGVLNGLTVSASIAPNANVSYNLGTVNAYWGNVYASNFNGTTFSGTAVQAKYADLAEYYLADTTYGIGTVLEFGGVNEVTLASPDTRKIAGVVSLEPAYVMNTDLQGEHTVAIALQGRVPCKVKGTVSKGDMLVSAGNGYARAELDPKMGMVIGKSLENFNGYEGLIEVVVGRV